MAVAEDDAAVGAVELGPGLFQNKDPQLIAMSSRKDLTLIQRREIVINNDDDGRTVLGELYSIYSFRAELLREDKSSDPIGPLSHRCQHAQKVAVAELALPNVSRLDLVGKDPEIPRFLLVESRHLLRPHPLYLLPLLLAILNLNVNVIPVPFQQTRFLRRKIRIDKFSFRVLALF